MTSTIIGDGIADDTLAIQQLINTTRVVVLPAGTFKITAPLTFPFYECGISGVSSSLTKLKICFNPPTDGTIIGALDFGTNDAKSGSFIEKLAIIGDILREKSLAINVKYWTNCSVIRDVRIDNMANGIRLEKSWYGIFENVRIRNGSKNGYGLEFVGTEQVNGTVFDRFFISGFKHAVYFNQSTTCYVLSFRGCTFEGCNNVAVKAKSTVCLNLDSCYFENNNISLKSNTTVPVVFENPTSIYIGTHGLRSPITINNCYFNESKWTDGIDMSKSCLIYCGSTNVSVALTNSFSQGDGVHNIDRALYVIVNGKAPIISNWNATGSPFSATK